MQPAPAYSACALLCLLAASASAQQDEQRCRTRDELITDNVLIPAYDHGRSVDSSLSSLMCSIYKGDRTSSYLTIPFAIAEDQNVWDKAIPLSDGEGREGYLFEAHTDLFYTNSSGRRASKFLEAGHRVGAYFNTTLRMTNDNSHPLLPANWKIGLAGELPIALSGFYKVRAALDTTLNRLMKERNDTDTITDKSERDSTRNERNADIRSARLKNNARIASDNRTGSRFLYATWQVLHYSNGQDSGFYADRTSRRNDYRSGDFSTNYYQVKLNYAHRYVGNMVIVGAGIRRDFGPNDSGIAFSSEQEHSYGRTRFVGHVQWRSKAFAMWLPFGLSYLKRRFEDVEAHCMKKYRLREYGEFRARVEVEGILESERALGSYPHEDKHRWGTHLWLELNTLRSYSIGFFMHGYYGRDYLNIRYDRVVWLLMGGFSFTLEKYIPFNWRSAEAVVDDN